MKIQTLFYQKKYTVRVKFIHMILLFNESKILFFNIVCFKDY